MLQTTTGSTGHFGASFPEIPRVQQDGSSYTSIKEAPGVNVSTHPVSASVESQGLPVRTRHVEMSSSPLFLGLDSSTQALKASLLTSNLDVIAEAAVNFDQDLPQYGTKSGVLYGPEGSGEVNSPVMLVVEAMDLLFERMKAAGWELDRVRGISAAGQQHASVYWSHEASSLLSNLDPTKTLHSQLSGAFSRPVIPNWQDSSTTAECLALEDHFGGPSHVAQALGSRAYERFTGPQIARWKRIDPKGYANTARISLVSSFITTLVCADGEVKGIDESDACGMNLWSMDTPERGWNKRVLAFVAGSEQEGEELEKKLGRVETDGGRVVGMLGKWFQDRYEMSGQCAVFPGTGDNPATFLSLTLRDQEGMISMGTSDVVLVSTAQYLPNPEYHAFFHPAQIAPTSSQEAHEAADRQPENLRYFNMLVYKNGSLPRTHIMKEYFDGSWDKFNAAVEARRPKRGDKMTDMGFWWVLPDIIPSGAHGIFRYVSGQPVEEFSERDTNAIAILHSQFLNYRARSSTFLPPVTDENGSEKEKLPHLSRVYATGGAAANDTLLGVLSDVFNAPVCKNVEFTHRTGWVGSNWNACSVGAAYKAKWGWERYIGQGDRQWVGFDEIVNEAREMRRVARLGPIEGRQGSEEEGIRIVVSPDPERAEVYESWVDEWKELENRALEESFKRQTI